ncbi:MAG: serine aminopeptidase domain-containing protein [Planctomycetota bacterium]|jgi:alpha/beta superfamily hydrolase
MPQSTEEPPAGTSGAADLTEESGYIPSSEGHVYGLLLQTEAAVDEANGVVLLSPLAEERKSSLRALVETARDLAPGLIVLRIDFRGTGDSSGSSEEMTLDSMVEDAVAAADWLRESFGCRTVCLCGLRLGAAVALLAADRSRAEALVLVEPVVSGARYVRELERRQSIRRMLTKDSSDLSTHGDGGPTDLDGLALDRSFLAPVGEIDLIESARELAAKGTPWSLVLQVGARKAARKELADLAAALGEGASLEVVVSEPFWLQTGYVDPAPAVGKIADFLAPAAAPSTGSVPPS